MQPAAALTPGRVVDVIDRTFRIYRDNFLTFIILAAIVTVPMAFIEYAIQEAQTTTEVYTIGEYNYTSTTGGSTTGLLLVRLVNMVLQALVVNGLITCIASENYLGRRVNIGQAFPLITGRFGSFTGGLILFAIIFVVGFLAIVISGSLCIVPFLALPILGYFYLVIYFFIVPVFVLEDVGPAFGLRRALSLGKVRFWSVLGFVVAIWLITAVIQMALGSAVGVMAFSTMSGDNLVLTVLGLALGIFLAPIMPIGLTMMYYNIRIQVEGLDLALQAVDKPDPRPSDVYSPDPEQGLLTRRDLGNIVILIGVLVVFVCGLTAILGVAFSSIY